MDHRVGHGGGWISDTKWDPEQSFPHRAHAEWVPFRQILLAPAFWTLLPCVPQPPASPPCVPPAPHALTLPPQMPSPGPAPPPKAPTGPARATQGSSRKPPTPRGPGCSAGSMATCPASGGGNPLPVPPRGRRCSGRGPLAVATPEPCSEPGRSARTMEPWPWAAGEPGTREAGAPGAVAQGGGARPAPGSTRRALRPLHAGPSPAGLALGHKACCSGNPLNGFWTHKDGSV